MLKSLFPRVHQRYRSLPILGPTLDAFAEFLVARGFPRLPIYRHIGTALRVDEGLRSQGCRDITDVSRVVLRACGPPPGRSQDDRNLAATVRLLERYFDEAGILPSPPPGSHIETTVTEYLTFLCQVRGFAPSTIKEHGRTALAFSEHVGGKVGLANLALCQIEDFVCVTSMRVGRETLQHVVSELRSFLRFLSARGEAPTGLDLQIDTPRVYRDEQLPRALPWETVEALLRSIDRSTPIGLRDYAIFSLITTYGLRSCEIIEMKLENIEWRAARLCVRQRKTSAPLLLPLTDNIGEILMKYLRCGRPAVCYREVFVRHRAPSGVLKPTAVTEAFQAWSRRSGLEIPFHGPHCLRHSYALHLLNQGTSLKTIGDLLGHRNAESTCVYLRLAVEDLRDVPLSLPSINTEEIEP